MRNLRRALNQGKLQVGKQVGEERIGNSQGAVIQRGVQGAVNISERKTSI